MELRRAEAGDRESICALEAAASSWPWSCEAIAAELAHEARLAFVAEQVAEESRRVIVGFVLGRCTGLLAELTLVAVAPAERRRGIARRLVLAFAAAAKERGATEVHLELRAGNSSALALYQRGGFACVGRRKKYYAHGNEDAVLMTLDLATLKESGSRC